ncbi:MAG: hypothetical protein IJW55_10195 [Clostridia bacterium]|nr:hypothetical protein [Clostridia bacterium]MBQ7348318.1 hypothetical protein [Clostridia bacterium]
MMRGAQKQMIVVRTGDSRYFDEAYFVLRREVKTHRGMRSEMLSEANRILRESELDPRPPRKALPRGVCFFLLGILCGGIVAALVCLLIL